METTLAVMERQQQFDFQKNGIEVMNFETLQRTYKENDIYNNPFTCREIARLQTDLQLDGNLQQLRLAR